MTRLEQHKQKVFYRKVVGMTALLIFLLIFIFFIGFQVILKSSGFVGSLGKDTDTTQNQEEDFFGTLDVDEVPPATNSASFIISGNITDFDTLEFYINNSKKKSVNVKGKDSFSQKIPGLQKGKNEVYIKAITEDRKHSKKSDVYTLLYKSEKPKLEVKEPGDDSKTDKTEITVAGTTDQDVTIKVNSFPTVVDAQGGFRTTVRLQEGENKIIIMAIDDAGNTEQKEIKVTYQKE